MEAMDSDRLEVFVSVAKEQGFSAAARALGRSQPAVSQAVAALEHDLGQRLFVREGRTIVLTHAGRVLLEHAERALEELRRARQRIVALSELRAGRSPSARPTRSPVICSRPCSKRSDGDGRASSSPSTRVLHR